MSELTNKFFIDNFTAPLTGTMLAATGTEQLNIGASDLAKLLAILPLSAFGLHTMTADLVSADGLLHEIVWLHNPDDIIVNVLRAQEGTAALAWSTNDFVSVRLTAGIMNNIKDSFTAVEAANVATQGEVDALEASVQTDIDSSIIAAMNSILTDQNSNILVNQNGNILTN